MNGILNILKPPGMTSSDVVVYIRRLLGVKRAGHSGTLDPAAAGVLPVFIGTATRLCEYAINDDKEYIGEICFGSSTDTQDAQGNVLEKSEKSVELEEVQALFAAITGHITQIPPKYSAIKKDGKKLYEYARSGQDVEIKPRQVEIRESVLVNQTGENRFLFRIVCSKGTYIRTICHDIGEKCGAHAHLSFLLRTKTGGFCIEDAVLLDDLAQMNDEGTVETALLPMDTCISYMPSIKLLDKASDIARNGGVLVNGHIAYSEAKEDETARLYAGDDFIGICRRTKDGVKVKKVLG